MTSNVKPRQHWLPFSTLQTTYFRNLIKIEEFKFPSTQIIPKQFLRTKLIRFEKLKCLPIKIICVALAGIWLKKALYQAYENPEFLTGNHTDATIKTCFISHRMKLFYRGEDVTGTCSRHIFINSG